MFRILDEDQQDPVRQTRDLILKNELPMDNWYDAEEIATSQDSPLGMGFSVG